VGTATSGGGGAGREREGQRQVRRPVAGKRAYGGIRPAAVAAAGGRGAAAGQLDGGVGSPRVSVRNTASGDTDTGETQPEKTRTGDEFTTRQTLWNGHCLVRRPHWRVRKLPV